MLLCERWSPNLHNLRSDLGFLAIQVSTHSEYRPTIKYGPWQLAIRTCNTPAGLEPTWWKRSPRREVDDPTLKLQSSKNGQWQVAPQRLPPQAPTCWAASCRKNGSGAREFISRRASPTDLYNLAWVQVQGQIPDPTSHGPKTFSESK